MAWGFQVGSGRWTARMSDHLRLRKRRLALAMVNSQQDAADRFRVETSVPKEAARWLRSCSPAIPYRALKTSQTAAVGRVDTDVDVAWQSLRHLREFFKPVAQVRMSVRRQQGAAPRTSSVVPGTLEDEGRSWTGSPASPSAIRRITYSARSSSS